MQNFYCRTAKLLLLSLLFGTYAFAQDMQAQEGMKVDKRNYTSFSSREIANIEAWKKYNLPEYYDHPEFGKLPKDAPNNHCVEDLSKRNFDERYFVDVDDPTKFYQQKAIGYLHAQVNGDWVTIDHSLQPSSTGIYESGYGAELAGFDVNTHKAYIKTVGGVVYFNNWTMHTLLDGYTGFPSSMSWENFTVGDDGIYITEAFPGIDAEMIVFRGAIKTNFILKSNEFGVFDELVFRDQFTAPDEVSMQFMSIEGSEGAGEFSVFSGQNNLLHVGEAILFAQDGPKDLVRSGEYVLNGNTMDVRVPYNWINENIGSYRLVVDPTVTGTSTLAQASITGSMYNASCNFTNSCNYNLVVARPANATLTNVAWTFTYTANGTTCWLQDGAIRIASGACVSPATAGYYWFCNAVGGGTCTGTNQTIFSDVSSCMPAPSCAPQNVTFTLQFFRSCWGSTGCSNTCIGAGSPWTMTITGQTLAYTNTVTPITLSATTVCAGGSITASTTGQYGVPGYTYNWSFSPTGSPSVGSGSSASIVFPTSGTVTLYSFVTDACGNVVTSSRTVTVTPGPTINVNSPTVCAGQSVTLTATGATSYTWTPSGTLSSGSGSSVTATPASTTTYTVTGTTSGCSGTATSTVTVNPLPTVSVNSPTICNGGSATLTATGATSYTWTPSGTLSSASGSPVTATPTTTTTYTVTGTTSGCSNTATATVTVTSNPVINVNSPTICEGQSATLTATGATSYTWTPTGTLSSGSGSPVTATPATTTTYTVTGTTAGCSGTATATVTVNPLPIVNVNSATICEGDNATLTATGATSYTWTPSGTLSSASGSPVTATPSTTTTYTVTGTTGSCSNTATSTVTVNPNPVVSVNSPSICEGASVTLTAMGATTYSWTPSGTLSSGSGSPVTATPVTTTTYTVTGTTGTCTGTATATVTVNPNPVVNVNSATICDGDNATLTATGATSYSWTPSATLSSGSGSPVTATPTTTTTYTVTGTTGSCTGTGTATVTVTPLPNVTVNNATICAGQSATLTANGATSYNWTPSGSLTSASGSPVTATPATTTTYTVTGTSSGCSNTATSVVTVNPLPTISASNNGPLCPGETLILTGNGQMGSTYSWSGPNSFSSSTQNPQITSVSSAHVGTYSVTATLNGCTNTATTTFALNPGLVSTINPSGPYCKNDPAVQLSAVNPGGTWSGTGITNAANGMFDPSVASVGNNTVTYTLPGGCGGPSSATIVVNPIPSPTFSANVTQGCAPLVVQFTDNTNPASSSVSWDFGNGQSSTAASPSAQYDNVGCFPVTLTSTDANGCTNSATVNSYICVLADPNAQFHAADNEKPVSNPVFQFLNTSTDAVSYVWTFGDGTGAVQTNPSHTYEGQSGSYTVELIAYNAAGCSDTARLIVTVQDEQIFFVPNAFTPNGDEHNNTFVPVFTSGIDPQNFHFTIFNRWGETVFETYNMEVGWDGTYHGKVVPSGAYTWSLWFKNPKNDGKFQFSGHLNVMR